MARPRHRSSRPRRASSADIRFTLVLLALGAVVLVLASALLSQLRDGDGRSAAVSGGLLLLLLAVGAYSVGQKRRR
jgi:hypothetical protein